MLYFSCSCWKDINMFSWYKSPRNLIPFVCHISNTLFLIPGANPSFLVSGISPYAGVFFPTNWIISCQALIVLWVIGLSLIWGVVLVSLVSLLNREKGVGNHSSTLVTELNVTAATPKLYGCGMPNYRISDLVFILILGFLLCQMNLENVFSRSKSTFLGIHNGSICKG